MLQLLQPGWLFALAGISIPVIIHLWNPQPGKVLKVGSISLAAENEKEYKRRLQLSDWLLLLLRCLLIAMIAFALAKPVWRSAAAANKEKGWILMPRQNINAVYDHFKPVADSLIKAGYAFHYFEDGFAAARLDEAVKQPDSASSKAISYWKLIESLDEQTISTFPLILFTDNYLKNFSGTRPAVALNLHWLSYTTGDTVNIENAIDKTDTAAFHITLFTDKYNNDINYLKAAVEAIREFSKKNISLSVATSLAQLSAKQDWLFWLSETPLKPGIEAKNVLLYENGKIGKTVSWINETGYDAGKPIQLYQSVTAVDAVKASAQNIWQDGFGNPVLSKEKKDSIHSYYHCYTHFNPAWNELPWSSNFPAMIYQLLDQSSSYVVNQIDKRTIDQKQLLPEFIKENGKGFKSQVNIFSSVNINGFFWISVFLLFFIERLVSFQYHKLKSND